MKEIEAIRAALAARPTPADTIPWPLIADCNPSAMTAALAHIEEQAKEISILRRKQEMLDEGMFNERAYLAGLELQKEIGTALHGGIFAGFTTRRDGTHCAVILLPDQGTDLTWKKACNWAQKLEAELPSRPVAALLFANVKDQLRPGWHWTSEPDGASFAWGCSFSNGSQNGSHKSFEGAAVAVRLIPLTV